MNTTVEMETLDFLAYFYIKVLNKALHFTDSDISLQRAESDSKMRAQFTFQPLPDIDIDDIETTLTCRADSFREEVLDELWIWESYASGDVSLLERRVLNEFKAVKGSACDIYKIKQKLETTTDYCERVFLYEERNKLLLQYFKLIEALKAYPSEKVKADALLERIHDCIHLLEVLSVTIYYDGNRRFVIEFYY